MTPTDMRKLMEAVSSKVDDDYETDENRVYSALKAAYRFISSPSKMQHPKGSNKTVLVYETTQYNQLTNQLRDAMSELRGSLTEEISGLDSFCRAYLEAALWSSTDNSDDSGGEPLDKNYDINDIDEESLREMMEDCTAFQEQAGELIDGNDEQAGHDFWLTRNGHGAGFWDGDWPEDVGEKLTALSKKFGEVDLYIGDDGKIYAS